MRAVDSKAPLAEPWQSEPRSGETIRAIVPPVHGKSADGVEVGDPEIEGRTKPFERVVHEHSGPEEEARGVAAAAPASRCDAPCLNPASTDMLGLTRVGKYELTGTLGRGSFGVVFTARDTALDREVAIKILNPSHQRNEDTMHRFLREARAAARISHPGIVTVLDFGHHVEGEGEDDDKDKDKDKDKDASEGKAAGVSVAYIAMERLCGESLTSRLARVGRMAPEEAAEVVRQVASALEAAHRADVLHRDLKPDNVFLVADPLLPWGERAKVLDFGLAKIGSIQHTQMGRVFGTPLYMSPEQCVSSGNIDARSDIYALGCILFELLVGRPPFEGPMYRVLQAQRGKEAPSVASLAPGIPPALDVLVRAMLEKDPEERPQSMADVASTLEDVLAVRARGSAQREVALPSVPLPLSVLPRPSMTAQPSAVPRPSVPPPPLVPRSLERDEAEDDRGAIEARAGRLARLTQIGLALVVMIAVAAAFAGALWLVAANGGTGDDAAPRARPGAAVDGMTPAP